tara:strand:- start:1730 stop:1849 length:120 start_codon:yes stop_codon:yes gene_type:complete
MITGWVIFGVCILVNWVVFWAIDLGFENNFWREDETREK